MKDFILSKYYYYSICNSLYKTPAKISLISNTLPESRTTITLALSELIAEGIVRKTEVKNYGIYSLTVEGTTAFLEAKQLLTNTYEFTAPEGKYTEEELTTALATVISSSYRISVLTNLAMKPNIPLRIAEASSIRVNHISIVLKELVAIDVITLINPEARKGRIYKITDKGIAVYNKLVYEGYLVDY